MSKLKDLSFWTLFEFLPFFLLHLILILKWLMVHLPSGPENILTLCSMQAGLNQEGGLGKLMIYNIGCLTKTAHGRYKVTFFSIFDNTLEAKNVL